MVLLKPIKLVWPISRLTVTLFSPAEQYRRTVGSVVNDPLRSVFCFLFFPRFSGAFFFLARFPVHPQFLHHLCSPPVLVPRFFSSGNGSFVPSLSNGFLQPPSLQNFFSANYPPPSQDVHFRFARWAPSPPFFSTLFFFLFSSFFCCLSFFVEGSPPFGHTERHAAAGVLIPYPQVFLLPERILFSVHGLLG